MSPYLASLHHSSFLLPKGADKTDQICFICMTGASLLPESVTGASVRSEVNIIILGKNKGLTDLNIVLMKEKLLMENAHVTALQAKHAGLDALIAEEERRPSPDMAVIADLKKRKLKIKEEMVSTH